MEICMISLVVQVRMLSEFVMRIQVLPLPGPSLQISGLVHQHLQMAMERHKQFRLLTISGKASFTPIIIPLTILRCCLRVCREASMSAIQQHRSTLQEIRVFIRPRGFKGLSHSGQHLNCLFRLCEILVETESAPRIPPRNLSSVAGSNATRWPQNSMNATEAWQAQCLFVLGMVLQIAMSGEKEGTI
jgi:hypothetical protein